MAKKTIYKLCVDIDGVVYTPVVIGYLSDGSYFIKDLSQKEGVYNISKMEIDFEKMQRFGMVDIPIDRTKQYMTKHKPKLVHHISGEVHVSGTGIISGNFKLIKKPKGVQVVGPHFTDGGPMGVFTFWGLNDFEKNNSGTSNKNHIIFTPDDMVSLHTELNDKDDTTESHTFELFYMDKSIKEFVNIDGSVELNHPHFGTVTLKILDHDTDNPALFAVMCRKSKVGWKSQHGVVYAAGTTSLNKNGFFEQISIIYPFEDDFREFLESGKKVKVKNLDFSPRFKIWCLIDDFLSKILYK